MPSHKPNMISIKEAAQIAGVCPRHYHRLAAQGVLPKPTKALGRAKVHRGQLLAALDALQGTAQPTGCILSNGGDGPVDFGL
jgi:hypothetical protein